MRKITPFMRTSEVCMDWILDFLKLDSGYFHRDQEWGFLSVVESGLDLGFVFTEKTLLVVYLTYIYPDSNRSQTAWILLVPDPDWIRIHSLQNRIGSGLKKIRVQTPLAHMAWSQEFSHILTLAPVSNEISDLCEISDLLLFFSYFASQSKGIKLGDYFFYLCCANENILVRCQIPTICFSTGITITTSLGPQLLLFFKP